MKFNKVGIFVNPNGQNELIAPVLPILRDLGIISITPISLAETLPAYAEFPNAARKKRIEEVLASAADQHSQTVFEQINEAQLSSERPAIIKGHFPVDVNKWVKNSEMDLLIKQSLSCDGDFGTVSKGDVKLVRHNLIPTLLTHQPIRQGLDVLVGVPPLIDNDSDNQFSLKLMNHAAAWAKAMNGSLHIVHAWDLFGESVMRSRFTKAELEEEQIREQETTRARLDQLISEVDFPEGLTYQVHLHKGDPTRIMAAQIDLFKPGLVVMGSAGRAGIPGVLLGNTAETIARMKDTSVLILR